MNQPPLPSSASIASPPRKFTFDTVFDGDRVIVPPKPKTAFTAQEVEEARAEVVRSVRELEAQGVITVHRAEEDELVD